MLIHNFLIVLSGFLLGIFFISLLKKISFSYNLLIPKGVPLIGGVGIGLTFILVSLLISLFYRSLSKEIVGIIISSSFMLILGVIDDWHELSIWAKFLVQIIATALLILFGIRTQIIYIGKLINIIITFIWVIGITNAFNHLDIMDGVASGTAMIVSFAFFMISVLNADMRTAILCLTLTGAILGFFLYNFPPAKIYIGNAGSHFLGFVLAAIALALHYAPLERKIALLSPLLILGFPIFDTAFIILMRIKQGKSIFKKSNDHFALRLLKLGFSKKMVLLFMLILALFFSFCGILLSRASNIAGAIIIILVVSLSFALIKNIGKVAVDG